MLIVIRFWLSAWPKPKKHHRWLTVAGYAGGFQQSSPFRIRFRSAVPVDWSPSSKKKVDWSPPPPAGVPVLGHVGQAIAQSLRFMDYRVLDLCDRFFSYVMPTAGWGSPSVKHHQIPSRRSSSAAQAVAMDSNKLPIYFTKHCISQVHTLDKTRRTGQQTNPGSYILEENTALDRNSNQFSTTLLLRTILAL
jgi:hypothetical protein